MYRSRPKPKGSSPRVWGQEIFELLRGGIYGIIPTRMGTSGAGDVDYGAERDHPHAYGDKATLVKKPHSVAGSSPRVWGQVAVTHSVCHSAGIIPTRMGTSFDPP